MLIICSSFVSKADLKDSLKHKFMIYSPAFQNQGAYPKLYTCDSSALSPPVYWRNVPTGTTSFALTMHHLDKDGNKHVYMVLYNIPLANLGVPQAVKDLGIWGSNSLNPIPGYSPPCSKGPGKKAYLITAYAISGLLNSSKKVLSMDELLTEIKDKVLDKSEMVVTYQR
ncbi:MAG: YbhB/YbcL family Raf kinase inhibitor-like protein [Pyrinomonadaceae bacterium]|nr:YbhB/YbcL family Raf kinase inhibitor-like protein [Sphingobacteriaceae bacterium]